MWKLQRWNVEAQALVLAVLAACVWCSVEQAAAATALASGGQMQDPAVLRQKRQLLLSTECEVDGDCGPDQCCVPTKWAGVRECKSLQPEGAPCHPNSRGAEWAGPRAFALCPCAFGLDCAPGAWQCVSPGNLQALVGGGGGGGGLNGNHLKMRMFWAGRRRKTRAGAHKNEVPLPRGPT